MAVSACVAVIVIGAVGDAAKRVTILPDMVATDVLELAYVKAPPSVLFDDGSVNVNVLFRAYI